MAKMLDFQGFYIDVWKASIYKGLQKIPYN